MTSRSSVKVLLALVAYALHPRSWDGRLHNAFGIRSKRDRDVAAATIAHMVRGASVAMLRRQGWTDEDIHEFFKSVDELEPDPLAHSWYLEDPK